MKLNSNCENNYIMVNSGWKETDDSTEEFPKFVSQYILDYCDDEFYNLEYDVFSGKITFNRNGEPVLTADENDFYDLIKKIFYYLDSMYDIVNSEYEFYSDNTDKVKIRYKGKS